MSLTRFGKYKKYVLLNLLGLRVNLRTNFRFIRRRPAASGGYSYSYVDATSRQRDGSGNVRPNWRRR